MSAAPFILCVDDDDDILGLIVLRLARSGYDVEKVHDGKAALAAVRERTPALVVLDVMLPKLGGFEVLARLKADPAFREIKVIMLSARVQESDIERGLAAGADAYLIKPFKFVELMNMVDGLLGRGEPSTT